MSDQKIRIAIDAVGGDNAPEVPVRGALRALKELPQNDFLVQLIGDEERIADELGAAMVALRYRHDKSRVQTISAPQLFNPTDSIYDIMRKHRSSMYVGLEMLRHRETEAFISAGNTMALYPLAKSLLGTCSGVRHPALMTVFPTIGSKPCVLLDVGANVRSTAQDLVSFAVMGTVYAEEVLDISQPCVGLMSIGVEDNKGNPEIIAAKQILEKMNLSFEGLVEGDAVFAGKQQVIVFDGFVGNVVLKFAETIFPTLKQGIKNRLRRSTIDQKIFAGIGGILLGPTIGALKHDFDYEEYGGAPLLGIKGVVFKAHGRSSVKALANTVRNAYAAITHGLTDKLEQRLKNTPLITNNGLGKGQ